MTSGPSLNMWARLLMAGGPSREESLSDLLRVAIAGLETAVTKRRGLATVRSIHKESKQLPDGALRQQFLVYALCEAVADQKRGRKPVQRLKKSIGRPGRWKYWSVDLTAEYERGAAILGAQRQRVNKVAAFRAALMQDGANKRVATKLAKHFARRLTEARGLSRKPTRNSA